MRSKTPSSDRSDLLSLALASVAALIAVTCAAGTASFPGAAPPADARPGVAAVPSAPSTSSAAPSAAANGAPPPTPADAGSPRAAGLSLPHFAAEIAELERHERKSPVRLVWLGDSHTAADFYTHAVRRPLQAQFGNGGPGFVQLGVEPYRHALLKVARQGQWRREPASPAGSMKQLDGVFGLGGQRAVPTSLDAKVSVEGLKGSSAGKTRFTLMYRAEPGDRLRVSFRGGTTSERADAKAGRAVGQLRHLELVADAGATLDVGVEAGAPQLFGVLVESVAPGIVLDTLGINGARVATPLAWNEAEWRQALAERAPALVVIVYGTNEAASTLPSARYEKHLNDLVGRVRAAAPNADCLIVGPPDMATLAGGSAPRVLEFDSTAKGAAVKLGCGFFSAFDAMGGEGSFARWAKDKPPLAAPDRIHLAPGGYEKLGQALYAALLGALPPRPE